MVNKPLARARLITQGVAAPLESRAPAGTPEHAQEIASYFAASQGQDFPGAISSLAYRMGTAGAVNAVDAVNAVREAFNTGLIVRGYPMRGTVFVTAAKDLAWITQLCGVQNLKSMERNRPNLGLDNSHVDQAAEIVHETAGARGATRAELFKAFEAAGIPMGPGNGYHLVRSMLHAGTVVYGPIAEESNRVENHVMLAKDWLPAGTDLEGTFNGDQHAAITELLRRYLDSHGPATLRDFAWWSKLPLGKIRKAFADIASDYVSWDAVLGAPGSTASGEELWVREDALELITEHEKDANKPRLLAAFDEIILGYQDRMYIVPEDHHAALVPGNNGVFRQAVYASGEVVGFWKRQGPASKRKLVIEEFKPLSATRAKQVQTRFKAYPFASA
ncbi:winged helix DNA-binding domain-containing protein [Corynebacterium casei]|uniref:winged helix DNA-binding domain-containing protein n=1 Tax=Corynebacterium casei TaxID=160386 RepID=UPI003FD5DE12